MKLKDYFIIILNILIFISLYDIITLPSYIKIFILFCFIIIFISLKLLKKTYIFTIVNILLFVIVIFLKLLSINNSTNYGFKKFFYNPVLGNEKTGSFFDPYVIEINNEYVMYFSDRNNGSIAVTKSKNGINWSSPISALKNNIETDWEREVNRASVIYKDGKYMMWYTGQINNYSAIGYALSSDGINFERVANSPIIVPEYSYEKANVMNPNVLYDEEEKIYKMWYAAGDQYEPDVICYATSIDGINWTKYINNPILLKSNDKTNYDSYKVGAVDVHKLDKNSYLMFYIGYTDLNTARIMYALSNNGINWEKSNNYVIEGSKFSLFNFDAEATYKPSAIYNKEKGKWFLWYNGRVKNREYIGFAYSDKYNFW